MTIVYNVWGRALNKDEILVQFEEPDRINGNHPNYITTQRRLGLWPLLSKTLAIKLSEDNNIDWVRIHEK